MAGFDPQKAIELFQIPEVWGAIAAFTIAYPGYAASLPEKLRERELAPRAHKPLRDFVMSDSWGHPASFLNEE